MSKSLQEGRKLSKHRDKKEVSFGQEEMAGGLIMATSSRIVPRINQKRVLTQQHQQGETTTVAATTRRIA